MEKSQSCIRLEADQELLNKCRERIQLMEHSFQQFSNVLALTGNEVRLKILFLLQTENSLCPCDLADILNMTVPAVSQHLRKLKDAHLVQPQRDGQTIFYSIHEDSKDFLQKMLSIFMNEPLKI